MVERALRRTARQSLQLTGLGIGLGAGTSALGGLGGVPAGNAAQGLANVSAFLPVAGTVLGAGLVIEATKGLLPREQMMMQRRRRLGLL